MNEGDCDRLEAFLTKFFEICAYLVLICWRRKWVSDFVIDCTPRYAEEVLTKFLDNPHNISTHSSNKSIFQYRIERSWNVAYTIRNSDPFLDLNDLLEENTWSLDVEVEKSRSGLIPDEEEIFEPFGDEKCGFDTFAFEESIRGDGGALTNYLKETVSVCIPTATLGV